MISVHWDMVGIGVGGETAVVAAAVLLLGSGSPSAPDMLVLFVRVPVVAEPTVTLIVAVVEVLGARAPISQVTVPPDSSQPDEADLKVTPAGGEGPGLRLGSLVG